MVLCVWVLYDFRFENLGEILLWEYEVLSLCSEQDIEGWFEGVNSCGDCGFFLVFYVQVICVFEFSLVGDGGLSVLVCYVNVFFGGFEFLFVVLFVFFKLLFDVFQLLLQLQQVLFLSIFQLFGVGFLYGGGVLQLLFQQFYGGYQVSQGSDDDWDDEWDDSFMVVDELGVLGSGVYLDFDGLFLVGLGVFGCYCLFMCFDLFLGFCSGLVFLQYYLLGVKSLVIVSCNFNCFFIFVKFGGEVFVLGEVLGFVKDGDKLCVVLGFYGFEWQENFYLFQCIIDDFIKQIKFKGMKSYIFYKLVFMYMQVLVYWCYKYFDWLYVCLVEKFLVIFVFYLFEKQVIGCFEEDFIFK